MTQLLTVSRCLVVIGLLIGFSSFGRLTAYVHPGREIVSSVGKLDPSLGQKQINSTAPRAQTIQIGKASLTMEEFVRLSPAKYQELTGKKLGFFKKMELKMVQKKMKKAMKDDGEGIPQWLYIVMSIFFLGWLAIGIKSNWKGNNWWIDLLLYFLFWLPGVIYALVVMGKYY